MKFSLKKVIAVILAVAMIVALPVPVFWGASAQEDSYEILNGTIKQSWDDNVQEGDLVQLQNHTKGQGIPIFIAPVHFGPDDVKAGGKLQTASEWAKDTIRSSETSFFEGFNDYFDIYVYVKSEEVYPVPTSGYTDSFWKKYEVIWNLCQKYFPDIDVNNMRMIYLGNGNNENLPSGTAAGQVGGWAYLDRGALLSWGKNEDGSPWEVNPSYWALHEFWGHAFTGFDDEYVEEQTNPDGQANPNIYVSSSGEPSGMLVKWRDFIGYEEEFGGEQYKIGIYQHPNSNRYMPTENSFMNANPCVYVSLYHKWVIYDRVMKYAGIPKTLSDFCKFMDATLPKKEEDGTNTGSLCKIGDTIYADLDSGEVICGNSVIGSLEQENACSDISDLKWVMQTVGGKTSSAAKFYKKGKCNQTTIMGTKTVQIGALKANGQFNSTVVLKAISKQNKGTTYATYTFYIAPAQVTQFKTPAKDVQTKSGIKLSKTEENVYALSIPEGTSYKLPFSAKDGADKTLIYTSDSANFSVLNGKVQGLIEGSGTITVQPVCGDCKITVNVTVTGKISKIRSNLTSLTMIPGLEQEFIISPSTSSALLETLSVSFNKNADAYTVKYSTDNGENWQSLSDNSVTASGAVMFQVALNEGKTAGGEKLTIQSNCDKKPKVSITLKGATAPQNVKNFKEKVKKAKNAKYRIVNISVGSYYDLGVSINPATADSRFRFREVDAGGNATSTDCIGINGDFIQGMKSGIAYVQAESKGINANYEHILSDIYEIHVHKPASSIVFRDDNMCVKGKYLMERTVADSTCDKELEGGKEYTFDVPNCGGDEPVSWTVSKPSAVVLTENGEQISLKVLAPGKYTVTGKTAYTKQSYSFNVMAAKKENADAEPNGVAYQVSGKKDWTIAKETAVESAVGSGMQIRLDVSGICDTVKFASANSKVVSVSSNGLVKVRKASDTPVEITASVGTASATIKVQPITSKANVKVTVPSCAGENKEFKVSTSLKYAKWYYINSESNSNVQALTVEKGKVKNGLEQGQYEIFPSTAATADAVTENDKSFAKIIKVYKPLATKVSVINPTKEIQKSSQKGKDLSYTLVDVENPATMTIKNMASNKSGVKGGKIIVLPIQATTSVNRETVMAEKDDIDWQTSNANLATVKPLSKYGIIDDSAKFYAQYAIEVNDKGYTGKVTLTGILKNSGKKVKVSIYVK